MPALLLNGSEVPASCRPVVEALVKKSWNHPVPIEWHADARSIIVLRMPRTREGFPIDPETAVAAAASLEDQILACLDA